MSDHDSTFMSPQFQRILRDNDVIHQPNLLKKTMNRMILQNNSSNWIENIAEIVDNYNDTGHSAIKNIKPKDAFLEKNHRTVYDIKYEKSFYINVKSDIDESYITVFFLLRLMTARTQ